MKVDISMKTRSNNELGLVITWIIGFLISRYGIDVVDKHLKTNVARNFISIEEVKE